MLGYRIPLHVDDALDSLDDYLNRRRIPPLRGNGNGIVLVKSLNIFSLQLMSGEPSILATPLTCTLLLRYIEQVL